MDPYGIPIKHERGRGQPSFVNPANLQSQNVYQVKHRYNSLDDFIQEAEIFQPGCKQNCVGLLSESCSSDLCIIDSLFGLRTSFLWH
jgi:hypothetical protein